MLMPTPVPGGPKSHLPAASLKRIGRRADLRIGFLVQGHKPAEASEAAQARKRASSYGVRADERIERLLPSIGKPAEFSRRSAGCDAAGMLMEVVCVT